MNLDSSPLPQTVEQAKERLLLATAAIGGTRRESELAAHTDALIAACRAEQEAEITRLRQVASPSSEHP